ncbi:hypothetical protein BCY84_07204 [Trypanosoma cruzi cruzi]|nr:hypothetical protein BCY84_07204 [Trypanosoma cruzi cruzi]
MEDSLLCSAGVCLPLSPVEVRKGGTPGVSPLRFYFSCAAHRVRHDCFDMQYRPAHRCCTRLRDSSCQPLVHVMWLRWSGFAMSFVMCDAVMLFVALVCVAVVDPCVVCVWPQNKVVRGHTCLARWPQRVAVTLFSREICRDAFTCVLFRGQCAGGCAVAGWRERSGREVRERRGQESRWVSRRGGHCPPAQHRSCRAPSITPQHRSRRQQHAARKRMPTTTTSATGRDTSAVVFRGGTLCGTVACPKPPRGVRTRHRPLAAECLRLRTCGGVSLPSRGRTPDFLCSTQADGCAMTPQRGSCFTMEG